MEENKKERKRISLVTYVISLILMAIIVVICMVIIFNKRYEIKESNSYSDVSNQQMSSTQNRIDSNELNKNEDTSYNTNKSSTENIINVPETTIKGIDVDSSKIDWEKYPKNMNKEISNMSNKYTFFEGEIEEDDNIGSNTLYSYLKNGYNDDSILKQYAIGDGTEIIRTESNYPQYNSNTLGNEIHKYSDKIIFEVATLQEDLYYYDDLEGKNEKEQEIAEAKMENAHNAKISETVAYQWNNLKNLTEYNGSNLKNKSYYYQINKIVIMNGYNESNYLYKTNARAKKIKVTLNNDKEYIFDVKDTNRAQEFSINYRQNNVEKPVNIQIEVLERYNGEKTNDIYISDIQIGITSNIPQGR